MTDKIIQQSIFDNIRRTDEQGNEFWVARELMDVLGYRKWERFASVVEVARENLEMLVEYPDRHASLYWETSGKTRRENYKLSRLGSYHVTLSCDSRGNERVKLAKHYFAVKTYEAETIIPAQKADLEKLRLENENLKLQVKLSENQQKLLAIVQLLEAVSPGLAPLALGRQDAVVERVEYIERTITDAGSYEGVGITYIQKKYGFKSSKSAWAWLDSIGCGKDSGMWQLQLSAVETHKLPPYALPEIDKHFSRKKGDRQLFLGETEIN